jgi:ABC-type multidrug transport system permease subunit
MQKQANSRKKELLVMPSFELLGKILILTGVFIVIMGLLLVFWDRIPLLGRLPGDTFLQKGNFKFYFPVVTSLIISLLLTIVINLVIRLFSK